MSGNEMISRGASARTFVEANDLLSIGLSAA